MTATGSGLGRLRQLLYRYRVLFAVSYVAFLVLVAGALWYYHVRVPASLDTGLTVGLRSLAHRDTFAQYEAAHRDFERAQAKGASDPERDYHYKRAIQRLEKYLGSRRSVQPDRLHTHAVVASTELLARIHGERGKTGRAAKLLGRLARAVPKNYRVHWLHAEALDDSGDLAGAADAFRRAFKLAPNHAELAESYLDVLSETNAFEDIVWVAENFDRAAKAGAPSVELKVGVARSGMQRRVLELTGVPVEHGSYVRSVTMFGLERGAKCGLRPPRDLLDDWRHGAPLYVQMRFENVYSGLRLLAMRYWKGGERRDYALDVPGRVATHHRPHSGVEFYVEVRTDLDPSDVERIEFEYACPELVLSQSAQAIVDRARTNLGGRR